MSDSYVVEELSMGEVPAERRAELWSEWCRLLSNPRSDWTIDVDNVVWFRRVHQSGVVWWGLQSGAGGPGLSVPDPESCGEDNHYRRWAKKWRGKLVGETPYDYGTESNPVRFDAA